MAKKIKRRKHHDIKEDKFVTNALLFYEFIQNHWKKFAVGAVALIVIIIVIVAMTSRSGKINILALKQFDKALALYEDKQLDTAETEFSAVLQEYGSSKYSGLAYLYLGKINIEKSEPDVEMAEMYFNKAKFRVHDILLKETAWLGLAECTRLSEGEDAYYESLKRFVRKFPDSYNVSSIAFKIAEHYFSADEYDKAKEYYSLIVKKFKNSSDFYKSKQQLEYIEQIEQDK
ncbi:MAG TPA: tetratricopeptide repeat protein [Candidatus Cloacimonetes bacterium]|nr:tetratricopeptide repeat protein [Candidatus Cloacimonadota bacterium]